MHFDHLTTKDKIVFPSREDLKQLRMVEEGLCAEIIDAEKTVALTEKNCAAIVQHIPEMMLLKQTEKDKVTDNVHISVFTPYSRIRK